MLSGETFEDESFLFSFEYSIKDSKIKIEEHELSILF